MRNKSVIIIVESGAMIALAVFFNFLKIYQLPNGGSVTLGSMVPIMFLAWRRGWRTGLLAGGAFGIIDFMLKPYYLHWMQFFLDYLLAFGLLGLVGFWQRKKSIAAVTAAVLVAGTLRFVSHVVSGVFFWFKGIEYSIAIAGSIQYNAAFMVPEIIISLVLMIMLTRREWHVS